MLSSYQVFLKDFPVTGIEAQAMGLPITVFATMLSFPILGAFLQRCAIERMRGVLWARWAINLMSVIIMFFSIARGDLCGYKFFLS